MRLAVRAVVALAPALLLVTFGCEPFDHDNNSPEPITLDHHLHPFVLHIRSINQPTDTLGIVWMRYQYSRLACSRAHSPELTRDEAEVVEINPFWLVYSDTSVHVCSTSVVHYVGYQLRYGGDTSRLGALDRYGDWSAGYQLLSGVCVRASGDTVSALGGFLAGVPDTVRAGGRIEWDVTVDLDGLLAWDSTRTTLALQSDHIALRQR